MPLIVEFANTHLDKTNLQHIQAVQDYVRWLNRQSFSIRDYQVLAKTFNSKEYEYLCKLNWDRFRDKEEYEFDNNDEYEQLKAAELKKSFLFKEVEKFKTLFVSIDNLIQLNSGNVWNQNRSL